MQMRKVIGALIATSMAMVAHADPFIYQGQLNDGGEPANGQYDLNFQLMDSFVGGSIIGSVWAVNDVEVIDGLFGVEVDFLIDHEGGDRWIEVSVRNGDSTGGYTLLSPRQPLLATPEAQHAKTADSVLNPTWDEENNYLRHGDGDDRVFINRSSPITFNEYFGVHGDTNGFVGMFVSGLEGSLPFYGYSTGGMIDAYSYINPDFESWYLSISGINRLSVNASGNVIAQNDMLADSFMFKDPKVRLVAVSGDVFQSGDSTGFIAGVGGAAGAWVSPSSGPARLIAPVTLPDGAVIKSMTVYCKNGFSNTYVFEVTLGSRIHGQIPIDDIFSVTVIGNPQDPVMALVDSTPAGTGLDVIDYATRSYRLVAESDNWPGTSSMSIGSVVIEYTIDEAN